LQEEQKGQDIQCGPVFPVSALVDGAFRKAQLASQFFLGGEIVWITFNPRAGYEQAGTDQHWLYHRRSITAKLV
jgi:hypothetical protein